ncbi:MAG: hypothetical protein R3E53_10220 [Myxococcota bacterium]
MIEANGPDFSIRQLGQRSGYSAPDRLPLLWRQGRADRRAARVAGRTSRRGPRAGGVSDRRSPPRPAGAAARLLRLRDREPDLHPPDVDALPQGREPPPAMDAVRACIEEGPDRFGEDGRIGAFDIDSAGRILWGLVYGLVSLPPDPSRARLGSPTRAARAVDALFLGMTEMENVS